MSGQLMFTVVSRCTPKDLELIYD